MNLEGRKFMPIVHSILNVQGGGAKSAALFDFIADRKYWVYRQPTNLALLEKYGEENCSRGWCLNHWGTPQNVLHPEKAVKSYDGGSSIRFETEDRDVRELIRKLSLVFKELYLDYLWASQDIGSNVGAVQYRDGEALIEFIPAPGTRAAIEKSLDILGARAADYGLAFNPASGNYEYGGTGNGE